MENISEFQTLSVLVDQHIGHIQLNRADAHNTMNRAFWQELPQAIRDLDARGDVRVVVLSSTGKHFSAGMDLAVFQGMASLFEGEPARSGEQLRRLVLELQDSFTALEQARMPVLAAIQGGAIGGALDLVCACDCRYSTEDAFFTIKETPLGMTADVGTLQRLPHLMPIGLVKELAYTGRHLSAQEAQACGFVNQVYADHDTMMKAVMKIAKQIAQHSPLAVSGCKHMIDYARDHSVAESLNYMATWQSGMLHLTDIQQAMKAQQLKQAPEYQSLTPAGSVVAKLPGDKTK